MSNALKEIKHYDEYDYVLINDNLDNTFQKIFKILDYIRFLSYIEIYNSFFIAVQYCINIKNNLNDYKKILPCGDCALAKRTQHRLLREATNPATK